MSPTPGTRSVTRGKRRYTYPVPCKWCKDLAGIYDYNPKMDTEVFRRHEGCRCNVEYSPDGVKRQNAWTKKWTSSQDEAILEARKNYGRRGELKNDLPQAQKIIDPYVIAPHATIQAAKDGGRHAGTYNDALRKGKNSLSHSIASHTAQIEIHTDKLANPERYIADWAERDARNQRGLLRKWERDRKRNAEEAAIELSVYKERFT